MSDHMLLILGIATAIIATVLVFCIVSKILTRRSKTPEWCDHGEMIHGKVHKLVDTGGGSSEIVAVGGAGSGTAMIAYFCAKHCPGGCNQSHERPWGKLWE